MKTKQTIITAAVLIAIAAIGITVLVLQGRGTVSAPRPGKNSSGMLPWSFTISWILTVSPTLKSKKSLDG